MDIIVRACNIKKTFNVKKKSYFRTIERKEIVALKDVSFEIMKGEIFGLLGPNGAGKTTLMKMIMGLISPSGGTIEVDNIDVNKDQLKALGKIGSVLAGDRSVYWKLTARENLEYFASLYGFSRKAAKERAQNILERLELLEKADITVDKFSNGMKQKVALGKALIPNADVVLLDEPTIGLDPQSSLNLRKIIGDLKKDGKTILISTHYMEEADYLCDRVAIIDKGQIIALDSTSNLKNSITDIKTIQIQLERMNNDIIDKIKNIESVIDVKLYFNTLTQYNELVVRCVKENNIIQNIIKVSEMSKNYIKNINVINPSLEDVFIHLTGKTLRD